MIKKNFIILLEQKQKMFFKGYDIELPQRN